MLKIAQITDLHLLPPGRELMGLDVIQRFESVLEHARSFDPDVYFFTGDYCASMPEESEFEWLGERLQRLHKPFYLIPGNHDDRMMMRNNFILPGVGDEPLNQALVIHGETFLLLDTRYSELEEGQLKWLDGNLAAADDAYVVMHHPPTLLGQPFMDNNYPLVSMEKVKAILHKQNRPVHVFCGHYHSGRTVYDGNIVVHLCPPTSFFIKPGAEVFEQDPLPPAYQQLVWQDDRRLSVTPIYLPESTPVPID